MERQETSADRGVKRRYGLEFGAAMVLHIAAVTASARWLRTHPDSAWRAAVAVAPVVPFALAGWAWVRLFRRIDELHRRMQVEALAFAFGGTALCVITYGFLETAGLPPSQRLVGLGRHGASLVRRAATRQEALPMSRR